MKAATIKMDAGEASRRYYEYKRHEDKLGYEHRVAMLGFQALSRGKELLDLSLVFRACESDEQGRPKLAVARADWERVRMDRNNQGTLLFRNEDTSPGWGSSARYKQYRFPHVMPARPGNDVRASAVVPIIPARFIPRAPLKYFEVLFEAEWKTVPVDPFLLRHLEGNLYIVLAKWDLTPVEQAALTTRLR